MFQPARAEIVEEFRHLSVRQVSEMRCFRNFQQLAVKPIASGLGQHFGSDPADAESHLDRFADLVEGLCSFFIACVELLHGLFEWFFVEVFVYRSDSFSFEEIAELFARFPFGEAEPKDSGRMPAM